MKNKIKFSIIVPVYNVDKYIEECIISIKKQTYENYELLLVDDGSTDKSGEICNQYSNQDERIITIHQENNGLSGARNTGLTKAKGDYIVFIDGDDYIDDIDFLKKLNDIAINENSDLIIYGYKKVYDNGVIKEKNKFNHKNKNLITSLIRENYYKACAWDKVIKNEIIKNNQMTFPIGKLSEDIKWCGQILKNIDYNKISILNENPYCYRQRNNSISKVVKEKHLQDINEMIEEEYVQEDTERRIIVNSYLAYEFSCALGILFSKKANRELKESYLKKKYLLKFNINKKVKTIYILSKIIGIQATGIILGKFINMKG